MSNICIIGGGAAGAMAAIAASERANVTILERNEKLMKKLFITGKGRCNVTNSAIGQEFLDNIMRGRKFFLSSFYGFDNFAVMDFFEDGSVPLKQERGGRMFPSSDRSSDIIGVLERAIKARKVEIRTNYYVKSIERVGDTFRINDELIFDKVIIATGGASYISTGSDGNMYKQLETMGHTIADISPSLSALTTTGMDLATLQGISLVNVSLSAKLNGREIYSDIGEMLFTHFGVSGPLVLSLSSYLDRDKLNEYEVYIDLKPGLSIEKLSNRIDRDFADEPKRSMKNVLRRLLPAGLIDEVLNKCNIDGEINCNQVTRESRQTLAKTLKFFIIDIDDFYKIDSAIITRGGVSLDEVNPKTMESKIHSGLYLAGEVLDIDALTGGYNLQVAFSTGHAAGSYASE